jgi:hypothetical protein
LTSGYSTFLVALFWLAIFSSFSHSSNPTLGPSASKKRTQMSITNFFKKVPAPNTSLEDESPAKKKAKLVELTSGDDENKGRDKSLENECVNYSSNSTNS